MVIISYMDTQYNIWYLPSESNQVMSIKNVSDLLIIMLITVFSSKSWGAFYPKYCAFTYSFII